MWPFGRRDTIRKVRDELELARREIADLKFVILDVQDKTQRWMQRSIKRADRAAREVGADEAALSQTDGAVSGGIDPISAKILNERARGKNFRPTE
jgi:hypothetical protein